MSDTLTTKEQFVDFDDSDAQLYTVTAEGAWEGKQVYVKVMSGEDRSAIFTFAEKANANPAEHPARVCVRGICTESGERVFTNSDFTVLMKRNAGAIQEIAEKVMEISGLSAEAVEEEVKNSEATKSSSSG